MTKRLRNSISSCDQVKTQMNGADMIDYNFQDLPDVRDGLSRKERIVLFCLDKIEKELGGRNVPTTMLYGRVLEYVDIRVDELQLILQKLTRK